MKSLKKTNLFSFVTAARGNRPNEQNVPVPSQIIDSFLTELSNTEVDNQQLIELKESTIKALTIQLAAETEKVNKLKLDLAAK